MGMRIPRKRQDRPITEDRNRRRAVRNCEQNICQTVSTHGADSTLETRSSVDVGIQYTCQYIVYLC